MKSLKNTIKAILLLYTGATLSTTFNPKILESYNTIDIIFAQQITETEFEEADREYNRLTSELNRLLNEMSKASETGNRELYDKLQVEYNEIAGDRKKNEEIRLEFMKQNKELANIKKIYNDANRDYKLGNKEEAVTKYNQAITKGKALNSPALDETISLAYYQLAKINKENKKFQDAINNYNNSIDHNPSDANAHFALGNVYKDINKSNLAIKSYQKAIDINNSFYQAYFNLGAIYLKQYNERKNTNLLNQAESAFSDAARINPRYHLAYTSLGIILIEKKKTMEAINVLNKSIRINSKYHPTYYQLARAYNLIRDPDSAIQSAQNCLKYRENYAPAFIELGDAYKQKGSEKTAIEWYKKALNNRNYRKLAEYKIDIIINKDKYTLP